MSEHQCLLARKTKKNWSLFFPVSRHPMNRSLGRLCFRRSSLSRCIAQGELFEATRAGGRRVER